MDQDSKKFFEELAGASSEEPKNLKISGEDESNDEETKIEKKAKDKKIKGVGID